MNGKTKVLITLTLIIAVAAAALYAVPIMANQNGATDNHEGEGCPQNHQNHDNYQSNQTQHGECAENMNSMHMNTGTGMMNGGMIGMGMGMMGATNNNNHQNRETHGMGH